MESVNAYHFIFELFSKKFQIVCHWYEKL